MDPELIVWHEKCSKLAVPKGWETTTVKGVTHIHTTHARALHGILCTIAIVTSAHEHVHAVQHCDTQKLSTAKRAHVWLLLNLINKVTAKKMIIRTNNGETLAVLKGEEYTTVASIIEL